MATKAERGTVRLDDALGELAVLVFRAERSISLKAGSDLAKWMREMREAWRAVDVEWSKMQSAAPSGSPLGAAV